MTLPFGIQSGPQTQPDARDVEVAIPAGMVPWHGGDTAPADWGGGWFLLRDGRRLCSIGGGEPFWNHDWGGGDVVAYTPRIPADGERERARDDIASMIALAGLGTNTGEARRPHGDWKPDEFAARILQIIPEKALQQCYALADTILASFSERQSDTARIAELEAALEAKDREWAEAVAAEPFLAQLRRVNTERYHAWVLGDGQDAGILFDAAELGGEVGELLNVVKKLVRKEHGWRGSRADPADFANECADVLICLDKLARRRGVDLEAATITKFNATSEKVGLSHRLATAIRKGTEQ
jgi:NTP pyrophosphatase (non-canonical NTP hydrolase)